MLAWHLHNLNLWCEGGHLPKLLLIWLKIGATRAKPPVPQAKARPIACGASVCDSLGFLDIRDVTYTIASNETSAVEIAGRKLF